MQERVNSSFMQVQCVSLLTDGISLFYCEINCHKGDVAYLDVRLVCDLDF